LACGRKTRLTSRPDHAAGSADYDDVAAIAAYAPPAPFNPVILRT